MFHGYVKWPEGVIHEHPAGTLVERIESVHFGVQ